MQAERIEQINEIIGQADLLEQSQMLVTQLESRVNRRSRANEKTDLRRTVTIHVWHPFGFVVGQSIPTLNCITERIARIYTGVFP